jgi:hypothetical protein
MRDENDRDSVSYMQVHVEGGHPLDVSPKKTDDSSVFVSLESLERMPL